jgi:hypothetical protein
MVKISCVKEFGLGKGDIPSFLRLKMNECFLNFFKINRKGKNISTAKGKFVETA